MLQKGMNIRMTTFVHALLYMYISYNETLASVSLTIHSLPRYITGCGFYAPVHIMLLGFQSTSTNKQH